MRRVCFLLFLLLRLSAAEVRLKIVDSQGASISNARVDVLARGGAVLSSQTVTTGSLTIPDGALLRVTAPGFAPRTLAGEPELSITLYPVTPATEITVLATPGLGELVDTRPETILSGDRPQQPTVAHSLQAKPNVMLQQTGAGQVSPFLRGLTGYQVLSLMDGVRYNNSTFRSGPNQYLAYLEPTQASQVEAMLGPSGTQYGSDGLGGTIQIQTEQPRFDDPAWHGRAAIFGQTADLSSGANAAFDWGNRKLWLLAGGAAQRHNDLRAGRGVDSHNALTRFYGLSPQRAADILGNRQPDTAYSQAGAHGKLAIRPDARQSLTAWYQRGEVHGLRNTKDLWGGLGRLQSDLTPQILDLFYVRYERLNILGLDSLSGRFSVNQQQDGAARQGLRATDSITREFNRVQSRGYTGQGVTHFGSHSLLSAGGELYDEIVRSQRTTNNIAVRPLYPDRSSYTIGGVFAQGASEWSRLRAGYGVRYTRVSFHNPASATYRTPESSQTFDDWTYNASLLVRLTQSFAIHASGSRGFRAPNLNDLGAIGLQDLGYEVPAREAIPAGALLSDSAGEAALSKNTALRPLRFESLRNLEAGIRARTDRHRIRLQFFDALLEDPIVRRTLLFPAGSVPSAIAGLPVQPIAQTPAQRAQGVVAVASAIDPRALKSFVNDGRSRYWGTEAVWEYRIHSQWHWSSSYSFLLGRDLDPNRNIRRLPPQQGMARIRYFRTRLWVEAQVFASGAQERLSGGDRDDERIGASRRRQDIADFFNSARGSSVPTGETLAQIQNRVLPGVADGVRVNLYDNTPGWFTIDLRAGVPLGETLSLETGWTNVADRNYRIHGSGIDAPGVSVHAALRWRF
jgi:outer membrane receptor protein involved in Fe transport